MRGAHKKAGLRARFACYIVLPTYGLVPLQLLDVLIVPDIVFPVFRVGVLRDIHAHPVVFLFGHLEVAVGVAPHHAGTPLLGKAFLDNGLVQRLLPLLVVALRQM